MTAGGPGSLRKLVDERGGGDNSEVVCWTSEVSGDDGERNPVEGRPCPGRQHSRLKRVIFRWEASLLTVATYRRRFRAEQ